MLRVVSRVMFLSGLASALFAFSIAFPIFTHAETSEDVRAAVLTEILRDPRVAAIPPAELAALVDALTEQAQVQSVTAADILWRPQVFNKASPVAQAQAQYFVQCETSFSALCPFNEAFGFAGADSNLPVWLFILSAVLLLLIPRLRMQFTGEPSMTRKASVA